MCLLLLDRQARMKAKSHHLNTYSYQSLSLNAHESKEQQPPPTSAHEAQQVHQVYQRPYGSLKLS